MDEANDAANVAAAYIILHGEDGGTAGEFFFHRVLDGAAFFGVDLALRCLVEKGSDDGATPVINGVIADNIPLQLL